MTNSLASWLKRNRYILAVCLTLLLVKLSSFAFYYESYDHFTRELLNEDDEGYAKDALILREFYPNTLVYALGYRYDSIHYIEIARNGYYHEKYLAWPPGYPLLIRLASLTGLENVTSGVVISNIFHFISVIVFYFVALHYIKEENAFVAAMLFAFFPPNFLSGTMALSDQVFMAFSLLSWVFLERKNYGWCGAMIFLASIMRFQGILIYLIYSLIVLWRNHLYRSRSSIKPLLELNISALFFVYWIFVFIPSYGTTLNVINEEYWHGGLRYPLSSLVYTLENIPRLVLNILFIAFILTTSLLAYSIKPELALYSLIFLLFYLSFTGTKAEAIGRLLGTIWPAFIYTEQKIRGMTSHYYVSFYIINLFAVLGVYCLLRQMNWMFMG